ncbi:hypothetical protein U0R10_06200 [Aquirufa sp. OSTEICH-129V]|uniref:Toxin-antitoxin system YwqK family antitoxin n=1 Tax=Aquirufa avitistagni TaxID=3104728 RepID=A0ABW6DEQ1_9BACT
MKFNGLIFALFVFICFRSEAQDKSIFSTTKPVTDTTKKAGGLFGGRLSTGLEQGLESAKNIKNESQAIWEDVSLKASMTARRLKKKVLPKDEYEGTKTERRVGNYGNGGRATLEEFNVVKYVEDEAVSPYVQEIWWYDPGQSRIVNTPLKENQRAQICHGPYRKIVNEMVVEEGNFYMGAKDGRWETYDSEGILLTKIYFDRGFPAGSNISYFDAAKLKIKEVIPFVYGKSTGQYLLFYPSGNLALEGKLDEGVRIGRWREFYEFGSGGRLKKELRYGKDKFEEIEPIIVQERDEKGKITSQTKTKFD